MPKTQIPTSFGVIEYSGISILQKLFKIQEKFKTFAITDDSDKTDPKTGKPSYKYTPGWKITEEIRTEMDSLKLMLIPNYKMEECQLIDYPVHKWNNGQLLTIQKKEVNFIVTASYTWVDVENGDYFGPINVTANGTNGTDKSSGSAIAMAERYFLLKFFHITTHEADEEPDAHDSQTIPGLDHGQGWGAAPAPARMQQQAQQPGQQPVNMQPQAPLNPYDAAVQRLACFAIGTPTHNHALQEVISMLSQNGINCTAPGFMDALVEKAQALREGRPPKR